VQSHLTWFLCFEGDDAGRITIPGSSELTRGRFDPGSSLQMSQGGDGDDLTGGPHTSERGAAQARGCGEAKFASQGGYRAVSSARNGNLQVG
jgi:hypothetical protein